MPPATPTFQRVAFVSLHQVQKLPGRPQKMGQARFPNHNHATAKPAVIEAPKSFVIMRLGFPDPYKNHERRQ